MKRTVCGIAIGIALGIGGLPSWSQADSSSRSLLKGAAVEYLYPEQVTVSAGKPIEVALHFRISDLIDQRFGPRLVAAVNQHLGAGSGELGGDITADAIGRSGDQNRFAVHLHVTAPARRCRQP